jgi:RsmE family RNA methyltransferase
VLRQTLHGPVRSQSKARGFFHAYEPCGKGVSLHTDFDFSSPAARARLEPVNLILLEPEELAGSRPVRLEGRRAEHIASVLRSGVGDALRVGVVGGKLGSATVLALSRASVELQVEELAEPAPAPSPLRLVLALPRPPALRRVLRAAAAFGVKRIALLHAARVEKSFWQSTQLRPDEVGEQLRLGLEQGRDTILPEVSLHRRFRPFVEDELPGWLADAPGLVGHPEAKEPCPHALAGPATVIVGPEGGWVPFELDALARAGARVVGLGERPLPVDTAVVALLARLTP